MRLSLCVLIPLGANVTAAFDAQRHAEPRGPLASIFSQSSLWLLFFLLKPHCIFSRGIHGVSRSANRWTLNFTPAGWTTGGPLIPWCRLPPWRSPSTRCSPWERTSTCESNLVTAEMKVYFKTVCALLLSVFHVNLSPPQLHVHRRDKLWILEWWVHFNALVEMRRQRIVFLKWLTYFPGISGANDPYGAQPTSYDYDAPLTEAGTSHRSTLLFEKWSNWWEHKRGPLILLLGIASAV